MGLEVGQAQGLDDESGEGFNNWKCTS